MTLIPAVAMFAFLPGEERLGEFKMSFRSLGRILFSRTIFTLALVLFGVGATIALSSSFMVYYLENQFDASPAFAGLVAGLNTVVQMFVGIGVGRLYDRKMSAKIMILAMSSLLTFGVSVASLGSIPAAVVSSLLSGAGAAGGYVAAYSATRNAIKDSDGVPQPCARLGQQFRIHRPDCLPRLFLLHSGQQRLLDGLAAGWGRSHHPSFAFPDPAVGQEFRRSWTGHGPRTRRAGCGLAHPLYVVGMALSEPGVGDPHEERLLR